jgi:hypothetical protein
MSYSTPEGPLEALVDEVHVGKVDGADVAGPMVAATTPSASFCGPAKCPPTPHPWCD